MKNWHLSNYICVFHTFPFKDYMRALLLTLKFIPHFVLLTLIPLSLFAVKGIKFKHLSIDNGLSNSVIYCITQDEKGYLWFGTEDGLNRYDGYNLKLYKHDPNNPASISNDRIVSLHLDNQGAIWIGTMNGLNYFDPLTDKFQRYKHDKNDSNSLSGNICGVYHSKSGIVWIGSHLAGLNKFDPKEGKFSHYKHDPDNPNSISNNGLTCNLEQDSVMWFGTMDGLNRFDINTETFTHFKHDPEDPNSITTVRVQSLLEHDEGKLLIGTLKGLDLFDPKTETIVHLLHKTSDSQIKRDEIRALFKDDLGNLWAGTYGEGLNHVNLGSKPGYGNPVAFTCFKADPQNPLSISNNYIMSIFQDHSGTIWVGTGGGGLNYFDPKPGKFNHIKYDLNNSNTISNNFVMSLFEDSSGKLWIGTNGGGLNRYDPETGQYTRFKYDPKDPYSLSHNDVRGILEDDSGYLWIATFGGGLNRFEPSSSRFFNYRGEYKGFVGSSMNRISSLYQDQNGTFWFSSISGLNKFDPESEKFTYFPYDSSYADDVSDKMFFTEFDTASGLNQLDGNSIWLGTATLGLLYINPENKKFINYRHDPNDPSSISSNNILCVFHDHAGALWAGTLGGGLNKMIIDKNNDQAAFIHWKKNDIMPEEKAGLPNDVVYGILEDDNGNLWLSTNKGISKFTPPEIAGNEKGSFRNYDVTDGLQGNEFNRGAFCKTKNGRMYFGGVNGINEFHPDSVRDNSILPKMVITKFLIFNKSVDVFHDQSNLNDNSIQNNGQSNTTDDRAVSNKIIKESGKYYLPHNISYTKEIVLSYRESVFSFEFAAIHFSNQQKNQYAYKMEGFEDIWNYAGNRRFATYTNLAPGEYTFLVKGSNNDGLWTKNRSEMVNLKVIITPPYWRTWWFYMLSSIFTIISLFLFINYREKRLRKEKEILLENQELSKKINEHQKELINTIVNNQEADRKRIAGELHDGLGSLLSTIKYNLDAAKDNPEQNKKEYHYKTSTELLDQACTDLRNISHEMIPGSLLKLGLVPAIDDFLEKLSKSTQLKIHFNTYKIDERFDESVEVALFRIIQESVNNIYKHAEATEVNIEMMKHEDVLNVIIEDNGKGFDKDQLNEKSGIGLRNMETRVSYINGKFEIDSTPGHGTNIIVEIPL